jgi:hypothetical protein
LVSTNHQDIISIKNDSISWTILEMKFEKTSGTRQA